MAASTGWSRRQPPRSSAPSAVPHACCAPRLAGASAAERRRQRRLGRIVEDRAARDLVQRLTDEVLRITDDATAARRFRRLVVGQAVPRAFGAIDRAMLRAGARLADAVPQVVMPLVRRRIVAETRGLVIPAQDPAFGRHVAARRGDGVDLNVNLLGEAILSDDEAAERVQRVIALIERPDVDYVSVKISALCAQLDVVAFEHSVERIVIELRRVFAAACAAEPAVFVNLDMEEYADVHLTEVAFRRVLDEPAFQRTTAGIVVQAYLPDSHAVLERLGTWAARRVASGGAPIKVRIVKGANLAMELVDAEQHGWVPATYSTKAETDASYKRLLDSALRQEWAGAVRVGVASHNLFDVAWALERDAGERLEIEMLEGMVPAQARAVQAEAGRLLLYCPIVRADELDASLAYLARRFDENTTPENFLRAMFELTPDSPAWDEQSRAVPPVRRPAIDGRHNAAPPGRRRRCRRRRLRQRTRQRSHRRGDEGLDLGRRRRAATRRDPDRRRRRRDRRGGRSRRECGDGLVGSFGARARRRAAGRRRADVVRARRCDRGDGGRGRQDGA